MKTTDGATLFTIAMFGLVVAGCNQPPTNTEPSDSAKSILVSEKGCCGKCATEPASLGKADGSNAAGCCGKCRDESAKTTNVQKKLKNLDSEKGTLETKCQNGCNACTEGDSASCKCGMVAGLKSDSPKQSPGSVDATGSAHVNSMPEDRDIFHYLLENHGKISRTVTELENGVKTVTESTDPVVAGKIQEHVASMQKRVEDGRPLRMWDELYREIFKHADKIEMSIEKTAKGVSVTETSEDEYVVKLIQSHAKVVSGFAKRGFEEARANHEPPK